MVSGRIFAAQLNSGLRVKLPASSITLEILPCFCGSLEVGRIGVIVSVFVWSILAQHFVVLVVPPGVQRFG